MKKTIATVVLLLFTLSSCCKPELIGNVANTLRPQETDNWCWAATTQMLAQHFQISVTQCALANHRFGMNNCCNPANSSGSCPKNAACNKPGWPELDFAGLKFSETDTALSWDKLQKQIFCSKKPMGYAYGIKDKVGHVLVIKGYITLNGTKYVVLNDPWAPCTGQERAITYEEYADPAGDATHWTTFYDLAKK